jgi:AmmeMemoRadiSam system protein B
MGALPQLRVGLDLVPSPDERHPGLLIRDPLGYSEGMLVCPPPLVPFLRFFDGEHEADALEAALRSGGAGAEAQPLASHLASSLARAGFLEDEDFARRREEKHRAFARKARRDPAHAGGAYPADADELRALLRERLGPGALERTPPASSPRGNKGRLVGIAAPHASPEGAWDSYRAAYGRLAGEGQGRTVVVLGTSHHGAPNLFGLTRKSYATPLGEAATDVGFVDALAEAAREAVLLEDYCHAVEHSIEFQVVFLQHVLGPDARIVPVLCGPFAPAGEQPEDDPGVARFLEALGALRARQDVLFVLGVDMAHLGRRYGDRLRARAGEGVLRDVEMGDRTRLDRLLAGDAAGFWSRVAYRGDALNWCGTSPFYTFLRAAPPVVGEVLHYEQWQIDPESVVSCAGLAFYDALPPEDE